MEWCMYIYVYIYIYIYIYICIYVYIYDTHKHIYMYIHVYIYIYIYMYSYWHSRWPESLCMEWCVCNRLGEEGRIQKWLISGILSVYEYWYICICTCILIHTHTYSLIYIHAFLHTSTTLVYFPVNRERVRLSLERCLNSVRTTVRTNSSKK
jgi:hypothetical protein